MRQIVINLDEMTEGNIVMLRFHLNRMGIAFQELKNKLLIQANGGK